MRSRAPYRACAWVRIASGRPRVPLNTEWIPAKCASDKEAGGPENGTGVAQSLAESACITLAATNCPDPSTRMRCFTKKPAMEQPPTKKPPTKKPATRRPWRNEWQARYGSSDFASLCRLGLEPDVVQLP